MRFYGLTAAALLVGGAIELARAQQLEQQNIQQGSKITGQENGAEPGQSPSLTSDENFINFCSETSSFKGKLSNGQQKKGGSCSLFGDLPSTNNMVSTVILFPEFGSDLQADTDFDISIQTNNMNFGSFVNPTSNYYSAPQTLVGGKIDGHTHVTCQDLKNNINPQNPPDPKVFAFFKGINDDGNGNGNVKATVKGGLKAGTYRCCTMTSARNHQAVLMPVAQRGAQDDCVRFTVGQGNGGANNNDNNNNNNAGANNNNNNAGANNNNNNNAGANNNNNAGGNNNNAGTNSTAGANNNNNNAGAQGGANGGAANQGAGNGGQAGNNNAAQPGQNPSAQAQNENQKRNQNDDDEDENSNNNNNNNRDAQGQNRGGNNNAAARDGNDNDNDDEGENENETVEGDAVRRSGRGARDRVKVRRSRFAARVASI